MRSPHRHDDGAAEVIGVVLLVGLVAVASFGLLLISEPTQERAADGLRIQRAENGLLQLSANFRSLSNDASRSSEVDLGLGGLGEHSSLSVPDTGRIVVTGGDGETVLNASLGAVEYEMDGTTLAYQGGGVWRGVGDRSQLVSMPPLDYRQGTVTLDFVAVEGADRLGSSRLQLVERRSTRAVRSLHFSDRHRSVRISVVSRYYGGWADYFREEFERATVIVDHDERRVSVYLGRLGGGFTADNVLTAFGGDVVISTGHSRVEGTIARDGTVTVDQASQHAVLNARQHQYRNFDTQLSASVGALSRDSEIGRFDFTRIAW